MSVLYKEPLIAVSPTLMSVLGVTEAIFLQQLHFWLEKKKGNPEKHKSSFVNGHWWVFNSASDWAKTLSFLGSERTIQRIIYSLRDKGVLVIESHNQRKYDKSNWYRIDYAVLDRLVGARQNDVMDHDKMTETPRQNDVTYTKYSPNTTQRLQQTPREGQPPHEDFLEIEKDLERENRDDVSRQVIANLMAKGIQAIEAEGLVCSFGADACQKQLDWLPFRSNVKIPSRMLIWAIRNQASEPPEYQAHLEAEQQRLEREANDPVLQRRKWREARMPHLEQGLRDGSISRIRCDRYVYEVLEVDWQKRRVTLRHTVNGEVSSCPMGLAVDYDWSQEAVAA